MMNRSEVEKAISVLDDVALAAESVAERAGLFWGAGHNRYWENWQLTVKDDNLVAGYLTGDQWDGYTWDDAGSVPLCLFDMTNEQIDQWKIDRAAEREVLYAEKRRLSEQSDREEFERLKAKFGQ